MNIKSRYLDTYLTKIRSLARRLGDVGVLGQLVFVVIVLLTSWSGVKAIQTNYGLQKQISGIDQQNALQKLENDNLRLKNQYFDSPQYLELSARRNFGLAAPGETEIVVPPAVALAHTVDLPGLAQSAAAAKTQAPAYQRHFQAWVDFFLHRQAGP